MSSFDAPDAQYFHALAVTSGSGDATRARRPVKLMRVDGPDVEADVPYGLRLSAGGAEGALARRQHRPSFGLPEPG